MYTVTFSIIIVKFPSHGIVLTVYNKPYKNNLVVRTQSATNSNIFDNERETHTVGVSEKHLGKGK